MNYESMSDFEINLLVAKSLGLLTKDEPTDERIGFTPEYHEKYPSTIWAAKCNEFREQAEAWEQINYCSDPSDAWPIIFENEIDIEWPVAGECVGTCSKYIEGGTDIQVDFIVKDEALRVAMICYLKLKETNNEH